MGFIFWQYISWYDAKCKNMEDPWKMFNKMSFKNLMMHHPSSLIDSTTSPKVETMGG
jgi:hypothetical protein